MVSPELSQCFQAAQAKMSVMCETRRMAVRPQRLPLFVRVTAFVLIGCAIGCWKEADSFLAQKTDETSFKQLGETKADPRNPQNGLPLRSDGEEFAMDRAESLYRKGTCFLDSDPRSSGVPAEFPGIPSRIPLLYLSPPTLRGQ